MALRPRRRGQRPTRALPEADVLLERLLAFLDSPRAMRASNELLGKNDAALAERLKNAPDLLECLPIVGQRLEKPQPAFDDLERRRYWRALGSWLRTMRELVRNHERWSQLSADDRAELLLQSAPERLRDPEVAFIACVRLLALPHEKMPSTLRGALQKLRSVLLARLTAPVQEMLWGAQPKRPRGRPSIWLAPKNRERLAYYYRYLVKVLADWDGPPDRDWLIHVLERLFFGSRCRPPAPLFQGPNDSARLISTIPEVRAAARKDARPLLEDMATKILRLTQSHPRAYKRWARAACALAYRLTDRAVQEVIRGVRERRMRARTARSPR